MFVGVLRLVFQIPAARSLKDRRRVLRSFKDRVQARLRLSVAEVGGLDQHQRAVVAIVAVANDAARVDELLTAAGSMASGLRDAVLLDRAIEILPFGHEGSGVGSGGSWKASGGPGVDAEWREAER
jgi:hypothetical protein